VHTPVSPCFVIIVRWYNLVPTRFSTTLPGALYTCVPKVIKCSLPSVFARATVNAKIEFLSNATVWWILRIRHRCANASLGGISHGECLVVASRRFSSAPPAVRRPRLHVSAHLFSLRRLGKQTIVSLSLARALGFFFTDLPSSSCYDPAKSNGKAETFGSPSRTPSLVQDACSGS